MMLKPNLNQAKTFDPYNLKGRSPMQPVWKDPDKAVQRVYEMRLRRPNPPSPEMVQRAQPFRADVVQMDAAIKHPTYQVVE
jgi:hypothetical protein